MCLAKLLVLLGLFSDAADLVHPTGQQQQRQQNEVLEIHPGPPLVTAETAAAWLTMLRYNGPVKASQVQPAQAMRVPVPPAPSPSGNSSVTGVVVVMNGRDRAMLASTYGLLRVLREALGSDTPVQIFYLGWDEALLPSARRLLEAVPHVQILDLHAAAAAYHRRWHSGGEDDDLLAGAPETTNQLKGHIYSPKQAGWHFKALAALVSSFERVVLLDADALPFARPEDWFALLRSENKSLGLFRDHVPCLQTVSLWLLRHSGLSGAQFCDAAQGQEIDSSAVIVDKTDPRAWRTLHVIEAINRRWPAVISEEASSHLYGDKDTWLIGALLARAQDHFMVVRHPPGYLLSCTFVDTHVGAGELREGRCSVLSWHLHLGEGAQPLYANSRQIFQFYDKLTQDTRDQVVWLRGGGGAVAAAAVMAVQNPTKPLSLTDLLPVPDSGTAQAESSQMTARGAGQVEHSGIVQVVVRQAAGAMAEIVTETGTDADNMTGPAWLQIGRRHASAGHASEAIFAFESAANVSDSSPRIRGELQRRIAHVLLTELHGQKYEHGHYRPASLSAALRAIGLSLQLTPTDPNTWLVAGALGGFLEKAGKGSTAAGLDAMKCYRMATVVDPLHHASWQALATRQLEGRASSLRLKEALHSVEHALSSSPGNAMSWVLRGNILDKLGRATEALTSYCVANNAVPWTNTWRLLKGTDSRGTSVEAQALCSPQYGADLKLGRLQYSGGYSTRARGAIRRRRYADDLESVMDVVSGEIPEAPEGLSKAEQARVFSRRGRFVEAAYRFSDALALSPSAGRAASGVYAPPEAHKLLWSLRAQQCEAIVAAGRRRGDGLDAERGARLQAELPGYCNTDGSVHRGWDGSAQPAKFSQHMHQDAMQRHQEL
jgi:tetratricopeptide (TPR) repeat protein